MDPWWCLVSLAAVRPGNPSKSQLWQPTKILSGNSPWIPKSCYSQLQVTLCCSPPVPATATCRQLMGRSTASIQLLWNHISSATNKCYHPLSPTITPLGMSMNWRSHYRHTLRSENHQWLAATPCGWSNLVSHTTLMILNQLGLHRVFRMIKHNSLTAPPWHYLHATHVLRLLLIHHPPTTSH